jgi:hypothetical protein
MADLSTAGVPQTLLGKTALISGSSTGIGAAIALELSDRGANIVLNYPWPDLEAQCRLVGDKFKTLAERVFQGFSAVPLKRRHTPERIRKRSAWRMWKWKGGTMMEGFSLLKGGCLFIRR